MKKSVTLVIIIFFASMFQNNPVVGNEYFTGEKIHFHACRDKNTLKENLSHFISRVNASLNDAQLHQITDSIIQESGNHQIDPYLVASIIFVESRFSPGVVSPRGAKGLMQLTDAVIPSLGISDPFDIAQNIAGGTFFLTELMQQFAELKLALAAYNAGPTRVKKYGTIPPLKETKKYVAKVISVYGKFLENEGLDDNKADNQANHDLPIKDLALLKKDSGLPMLCQASPHRHIPNPHPPATLWPIGLFFPPKALRFWPNTWRWLLLPH